MSSKTRLIIALAIVLGPSQTGAADPHAGHESHGHGAQSAHADHAGHHGHSGHAGGHAHGLLEANEPAPGLAIEVRRDPMSGWNLRLVTTHFRFAPESASRQHIPGEGHAHVYVDGRKLARLYGHWFHIPTLAPGQRVIKVSLNANDHRSYARNGQAITAQTVIEVAEGQ